jgi:hypothetical protein
MIRWIRMWLSLRLTYIPARAAIRSIRSTKDLLECAYRGSGLLTLL